MESLALYYPVDHQKHYLYAHPERPERVEVIKEGLEEIGLWEKALHLDPFDLDHTFLKSVHDEEYLQILERASKKEQMLDQDTYTTQASWSLALNAAGGGAAITSAVWDRKAQTGFSLTRPPGHHATMNRGMGFCLINNIAVAAEYLVQYKKASKIAIIDLDLHHGNGTQDIFWNRSDICYISIHQAPFYPGTGALLDIGGKRGAGATMNLPIPGFSGDLAYLTLVNEIVIPYLDQQKPEIILISFGFDTHWRDPLGNMLVSGNGIFHIMNEIRSWTELNCSGKLAVLLEGGYDLEAGRNCGQAVGAALVNQSWSDPLGPALEEEENGWRDTLSRAKEIWNF